MVKSGPDIDGNGEKSIRGTEVPVSVANPSVEEAKGMTFTYGEAFD